MQEHKHVKIEYYYYNRHRIITLKLHSPMKTHNFRYQNNYLDLSNLGTGTFIKHLSLHKGAH